MMEGEVSQRPSFKTRKSSVISTADYPIPDGFWARRAKCMARKSWYHFSVALIISIVLSVIGMVVGDFSISVDNGGWQSRGTLIADRQAQVLTVFINQADLASGSEATWAELENNVQPTWENQDGSSDGNRRLNMDIPSGPSSFSSSSMKSNSKAGNRPVPFVMTDSIKRRMQESSGLATCDLSYYSGGNVLYGANLWPLWKTEGEASALDAQVIRDICVAEQNTQKELEATGNCIQCGSGKCYPPFSLVFYARLTIGDTDFTLSCDEVFEAWAGVQADQEAILQDCVEFITIEFNEDRTMPEQCPRGFAPTMVDEQFGTGDSTVTYTSSVFATYTADPKDLYDMVDKFDRAEGSSVVIGAYDTEWEDFNTFYVDTSVGNDMILAMGSAVITALAILVHTRSPWITLVGLVQIILSFPLAYFVYTFIARLEFFPFLNFIGVFVVFALGADDIFVAVDKWKNARIDNRRGSVEDIAAVALPDAAHSMFLTTATTAVAFFGTAICPVAPLKCFAVFCGLLIVFDYLMCVLLVFPALCIYDKWLTRGNNFCCSCHACKKKGDDGEEVDEFAEEDEEHPSCIRRFLLGFYYYFHKIRWPLFVICIGAFVTSIVFAAKLELPDNSDVRLLSESLQYEQNWLWRQELLYTVLGKSGGAPGVVIWGVEAADTGNINNPSDFTQLVLDDTFNPSTTASQEYLVNFCDRMFAQDFAGLVEEEFVCPINKFNLWLQKEANTTNPTSQYTQYCDGASELPMDPDSFNACVSAWTNRVGDTTILQKNGVAEIMYIEFQQRVRFDSQFNELQDEWNLIEDWLEAERKAAPAGVNKMYHSSADFWWYDTNDKMLKAAFGAAGIALAFSGLVVLTSSRSFMLTLFSVVTIGYVLTATTAMLVAAGWTLGFLESVCFAILIGISCDFVIHFGHAYAHLPGEISKGERTKYALVRMGPSILAAAFTTICAAIIMLFTVISFFQQFAQILFFTVIQATLGTFIVFLTLTDCIGPSQPTVLYDKMVAKCCSCRKKDTTVEDYSAAEAEDQTASPDAHANKVLDEGSSLSATEKPFEESIAC
eukprot:CAMPEP_0119019772 /NCGR_PEP_ID=MMETSP1176-20130426/22619_1 /TAXON_ID=265551 /ORGANISM="Synedropsis recta cf, Strain CCMP1620" /LENGTH=1061 /DNA_ID=CAMNT_0006974053 /DNA_START=182 /DNA_END=3367 /DNA_ORIENTATION=+